ncbi:MAG TPA: hypothetical protein P5160_08025 [Candidatus Omnitrophota bacterium]|jgi:hypothetical protein|nr:hypothetical protein [Candidatus Omnitrophota bacterium]
MKKSILKYVFSSLALIAAFLFILPVCCCLDSCAEAALSVPTTRSFSDPHGCCPSSSSGKDVLLKECSCHEAALVAPDLAQKKPERKALLLSKQTVAERVVLRPATSAMRSILAHEGMILSVEGPPIFILNCVYRC